MGDVNEPECFKSGLDVTVAARLAGVDDEVDIPRARVYRFWGGIIVVIAPGMLDVHSRFCDTKWVHAVLWRSW